MEEKDQYYMQEVTQYVSSIGKWYRFFSVMAIIGAVLMILGGIVFIVMSIIEGNKPHYYGGYGMFDEPMYYHHKDTTPMLVMGIAYILLSGLMIPVAVFLGRGASAAKRCIMNSDNEQAVLFLRNTKSYWKFCGILTIVVLSIYILALLGGIVATVASL